MGTFRAWLDQNWFNLIQTLGIVASSLLATVTLRRETRARRLGDYLTVIQQHRELWSEAHRRPDLARLFQPEMDLIAAPVTVAEEEYLNLVIDHFHTGWLLVNDRIVLKAEVLAADARAFFSLPLPRRVWDATRRQRDPRFVRFIEASMQVRDLVHPYRVSAWLMAAWRGIRRQAERVGPSRCAAALRHAYRAVGGWFVCHWRQMARIKASLAGRRRRRWFLR